MHNILENIFLSRELYQSFLAPICARHEITQVEMAILLFISSNPDLNTATDVVKSRRMTKSAVSMAVRSLQEKGYIYGEFIGGNRRSVYLTVCDKASEIVKEGLDAQSAFLSILTEGLTENEILALKNIQSKMLENIRAHHGYNI
ncbi:MAG: winged helix-turn-helix transcriptional regulator [Clostridia bacterium]|nr:winged helix-turn-helix transcriptional regulator [Clostridia bacterium]